MAASDLFTPFASNIEAGVERLTATSGADCACLVLPVLLHAAENALPNPMKMLGGSAFVAAHQICSELIVFADDARDFAATASTERRAFIEFLHIALVRRPILGMDLVDALLESIADGSGHVADGTGKLEDLRITFVDALQLFDLLDLATHSVAPAGQVFHIRSRPLERRKRIVPLPPRPVGFAPQAKQFARRRRILSGFQNFLVGHVGAKLALDRRVQPLHHSLLKLLFSGTKQSCSGRLYCPNNLATSPSSTLPESIGSSSYMPGSSCQR